MARTADPRDKLIASMLRLVPAQGWTAVSLRDIADEAGIALAQCYDRFPSKITLVSAYFIKRDQDMLLLVEQERAQDTTPPETATGQGARPEDQEEAEQQEETARERLFDVAMARFDAMEEDKPFLVALENACRRDPALTLSLLPAWRRSIRCVLEAAGIDTTGLRGLLRQKIYGGALLMAGRTWLKDDSADMATTMAALDKQLLRTERLRQIIPKRC